MSDTVKTYEFEFSENRFHRQVWHIAALLAVMSEAEKKPSADVSFSSLLLSTSLPFDLMLNLEGLFHALTKQEVRLRLTFSEVARDASQQRNVMYFDYGANELRQAITSSLFSIAVDPFHEWIKQNVSTNYETWPQTILFAKRVRNAFSHQGSIDLKSPNAPPATWRGITIDHSKNQRLIGGYVSLAELIVLLHDFDAELSAMGAPMSVSWQTVEFAPSNETILHVSEPPPHRARET